jgi:hypothetical protein
MKRTFIIPPQIVWLNFKRDHLHAIFVHIFSSANSAMLCTHVLISRRVDAVRLLRNVVEPSGSATTVLLSKMNLSETGCEDARWMELAHDYVEWWALVLAVLNFRILPTQRCQI